MELEALLAIFGSECVQTGELRCTLTLSQDHSLDVRWENDNSLPHVSVVPHAQHLHQVIESHMQVARDAGETQIIFSLFEVLKEKLKVPEPAAPPPQQAAPSTTVKVEHVKRDKGKGGEKKGDRRKAPKPDQAKSAAPMAETKAPSRPSKSQPQQQQQADGLRFSLTEEQENKLVKLLDIESVEDTPLVASESIVSMTSDRRTRSRLEKVYSRLEDAGVDRSLIELGMTEVMGGSFDAVLDWLLLHVPREKLPSSLGGFWEKTDASKAPAAAAAAPAGKKQAAPKEELRDYEFGNWTGKFPKTMLHEFAQKKQCTRPAYNRARHKGPGLRFKVSFTVEGNKIPEHKKGTVIEIECPEACKDDMQGQHLAATYALYFLNKNLSLHTMLPPTYRAAWERWVAEEKSGLAKSLEEREKPKREFLDSLFQKITSARSSFNVSALEKRDAGPVMRKQAPTKAQTLDGNASRKAIKEANQEIKCWFDKRRREPKYERMLKGRNLLPVARFRDDIIRCVQNNSVTVLSGETGSGKSTQVPQFVLEDALGSDRASETHIWCTQPRVISAQSIAIRVAEEMGEDDVGGVVGYKVRLDSRVSRRTQLTYCTTGVLLRRLFNDPLLAGTTHVIVDEVHERSVETDFLLIVLLDLLPKRPDLKVILMSATADAQLFSQYFGGARVIDVPGRTFPCDVYFVEDVVKMTDYRIDEDSEYAVEDSYDDREIDIGVTGKAGERELQRVELGDLRKRLTQEAASLDVSQYAEGIRRTVSMMNHMCINQDLIEDILMLIEKSPKFSKTRGSVLIFLPSFAEISSLLTKLQDHPILGDEQRFLLLPLHSVLASKDQRKVFEEPPAGVRKIVLATNIAETGITIPDVVFVIDAGFENSLSYDPLSRVAGLKTVRISKASAKQRAGRAGRVQAGHVFRLFTRYCFEQIMEEHARPEMQRVPLEQLCLQILDMEMGSGPSGFLSKAISPPSNSAVETAMNVLHEVGALTNDKSGLSVLGRLLAQLPLEPFVGKMIVYAALFRCLTPVTVMAAATQCQSPFHRPLGKESKADAAKRGFVVKQTMSDHFCLYNAYRKWLDAKKSRSVWDFCRSNFLDNQRMEMIHKSAQELASSVRGIFGKSGANFDANANYEHVIKLSLAAGLYPRVAIVDPAGIVRYGKKAKKVLIHPSSCNSKLRANAVLLYQEIFKSSQGQVYLRETTSVSIVPLLLFSEAFVLSHESGKLTLDNGLSVTVTPKTCAIFKAFRSQLNQILANPDDSVFKSEVLQAFEELLKNLK